MDPVWALYGPCMGPVRTLYGPWTRLALRRQSVVTCGDTLAASGMPAATLSPRVGESERKERQIKKYIMSLKVDACVRCMCGRSSLRVQERAERESAIASRFRYVADDLGCLVFSSADLTELAKLFFCV